VIGGDDLGPPPLGACRVCGEGLAGEAWWVTSYPAGEHVRCRDWIGTPFPFRRQLGLLRRLYRRTRDPRARAALRDVGAWLARAEARWPDDGAAIVADAPRQLARLAATLRARGLPPAALRGLA